MYFLKVHKPTSEPQNRICTITTECEAMCHSAAQQNNICVMGCHLTMQSAKPGHI